MSDSNSNNPVTSPEHAAHEVILELCRSGVFEQKAISASGSSHGKVLAESIIRVHKDLTSHYKSLKPKPKI